MDGFFPEDTGGYGFVGSVDFVGFKISDVVMKHDASGETGRDQEEHKYLKIGEFDVEVKGTVECCDKGTKCTEKHDWGAHHAYPGED